ncbi:MAG TPA: fumarylacetoacetate hydrolase family protein [Cyclobacteriaceae bacterium]|nr:fumarylacetoacetate hydrolase family protein [Cyclobacteriaceae bacterium]
MKLIRVGDAGKERPALLINGKIMDVSPFGEDFGENFFATDGLSRLKKWSEENRSTLKELSDNQRIGTPFLRPSKIICIGLNYADHAKEAKMELPKEPVIFFKATSAMTGPNDSLIIPKNSVKTDWEVELAVVIGKKTSYITEAEATQHIAGYCLHNDYSERAFQLERNGQWVKGKSCDSFAPLGPFLATPDEIKDINNLKMWLKVNGTMMQISSSQHLVFKIPFIISYLSQFMTLLPGDVISTGTPAGVGMGMKAPLYLKKGDVIELGIEGLGEQRQVAV